MNGATSERLKAISWAVMVVPYICAHYHPGGLKQCHEPGIDEPDDHDGGGRRALDKRRHPGTPTPTAAKRFVVRTSSTRLILSPATFFRGHPTSSSYRYRNMPRPPSSKKIMLRDIVPSWSD